MTKKTFTRRDIYQEVTDKVVAHIEAVMAAGETWERPYVPSPQHEPVNIDGRPYRGMNWWLLGMEDAPSGCWATYRRWAAAGAQVRKGEKGTLVVFWKLYDPKKDKDEGGEVVEAGGGKKQRKALVLKHYTVFSAEQVDGFDLAAWQAKRGRARPVMPNGAEALDEIERRLLAYHAQEGVSFGEHGGPPCYIPALDGIRMPALEAFKTTAGRYSSWLHEIVHSTGAKKRLDRELSGRFGSEAYAIEELVAELGAAMGCGVLGIEGEARKDHACYLAHWLTVLKQDKRAIFTVASKAQAAVDYALGKEAAEAEEEEAA